MYYPWLLQSQAPLCVTEHVAPTSSWSAAQHVDNGCLAWYPCVCVCVCAGGGGVARALTSVTRVYSRHTRKKEKKFLSHFFECQREGTWAIECPAEALVRCQRGSCERGQPA